MHTLWFCYLFTFAIFNKLKISAFYAQIMLFLTYLSPCKMISLSPIFWTLSTLHYISTRAKLLVWTHPWSLRLANSIIAWPSISEVYSWFLPLLKAASAASRQNLAAVIVSPDIACILPASFKYTALCLPASCRRFHKI